MVMDRPPLPYRTRSRCFLLRCSTGTRVEKPNASASDSSWLANHGVKEPGACPRLYRSLGNAEALVRDDELRVHLQPEPQAGTGRAGPVRIVEAEGTRLQLPDADVAVDAGELLGEEHLLAVDDRHEHDALSHPDGGLDRVGYPGRIGAVAYHQPVDDYLDGVPPLLVEIEALRQVTDVAVDTDSHEAGPASGLEHLLVLAFTPPDHRRHDLDPATLRQAENGVHDLLDRLPLHRPAAPVAVGRPTRANRRRM